MTPAQVKQANDAEQAKVIARTETTRNALNKAQQALDEAEAKFEVALANQRIRWAKEEGEALAKLDNLRLEIDVLEQKRAEARFPIEEEKKKAHDLFIQAEAVIADAKESAREADKHRQHHEELSDILQGRIDDLTERETEVKRREDLLRVREMAVTEERNNIKKLSQELSIKLTSL